MLNIYKLTSMDWKDWAITICLTGSCLFAIAICGLAIIAL